jgi:hypothetical protein
VSSCIAARVGRGSLYPIVGTAVCHQSFIGVEVPMGMGYQTVPKVHIGTEPMGGVTHIESVSVKSAVLARPPSIGSVAWLRDPAPWSTSGNNAGDYFPGFRP